MKTLAIVALVLGSCATALVGHAQTPPSGIRIVQAMYGVVGSNQIDVTAAVQSLVDKGQTSVNVGNHLFGRDPAPGQVKTLIVSFSVDGIQYRNAIREGERLTFVTNAANANVTASISPSGIATTAPMAAPIRLASEGTCFLTGSTSVLKDGALIGLHAGTVLKILRDDGKTLHVAWGDSELDVDKRILTSDVNTAQAAVTRDRQGQAALAAWMAQQQDPDKIERQKAYESSARQMERPPKEAFGTWSNSTRNPLNRPAYSNNPSSNNEVARLLEAPPVGNPLDRGAYNKTQAFPKQRRPRVNARGKAEQQQEDQLKQQRDVLVTLMQSTTDIGQYDSLHKQLAEVQSHMHGMQFVPPAFHPRSDEPELTVPIGNPVPVSVAEWKAIFQASTQSREMNKSLLILSLMATTDDMNRKSTELIDPKDRIRARMTRMLLTWYHMELYNTLPDDGWDTTVFKAKRNTLAIEIKRFQAEAHNGAVEESWANLMSACNALAYPQTSLP